MTKIATTIAVLMLAFAASASAGTGQDFRSPDARPVVITQDFRSPDARPVRVHQDYRSPDARPAIPSVAVRSPQAQTSGESFKWGYLAAGSAVALLVLCSLAAVGRRRRHGLAIGS